MYNLRLYSGLVVTPRAARLSPSLGMRMRSLARDDTCSVLEYTNVLLSAAPAMRYRRAQPRAVDA